DLLIRSREMNISGRPRARFRLDAQVSAVTSDYRIAGRQPQAAGFSFGRKIRIKYFGQILLRYPHPFIEYRYFHAPFRPERQEVSGFVEDDILSSHGDISPFRHPLLRVKYDIGTVLAHLQLVNLNLVWGGLKI